MAAPVTIAYYVIQMMTVVLLPPLFITFLIPNGLPRHITISNNLILWTIQAVIACLLVFSGDVAGPQPSHLLCQAQSALMFGAPPALSTASLALVIRVWYLAWSVDRPTPMREMTGTASTWIMVVSPYVTWGVVSLISAILGGHSVYRYNLYCTTMDVRPALLAGISAAGLLFIACCFQAWTVILVLKRYRDSGRLGRKEIGQIDLALFLRVLVFSFFILVCLVLSLVAATIGWSFEAPDLVVAAVGPFNFLVFGSQSDVLEFWHIKSRKDPNAQQSTARSGGETTVTSSHMSQRGVDPPRRAIRIPLTFNALCGRAHPIVSPPNIAGGETTYNIDALHTLNQDFTTINDRRQSRTQPGNAFVPYDHYIEELPDAKLSYLADDSSPSRSPSPPPKPHLDISMTFRPGTSPSSPNSPAEFVGYLPNLYSPSTSPTVTRARNNYSDTRPI